MMNLAMAFGIFLQNMQGIEAEDNLTQNNSIALVISDKPTQMVQETKVVEAFHEDIDFPWAWAFTGVGLSAVVVLIISIFTIRIRPVNDLRDIELRIPVHIAKE